MTEEPTPAKKSGNVPAIASVIVLLVILASCMAALDIASAQWVVLGAGAVAWIFSMVKLRGSGLVRLGGGFLIGIGVLVLSSVLMTFCRGVMGGIVLAPR